MELPIKNGGSFHSYVSLPEGTPVGHVMFQMPGRPGDLQSDRDSREHVPWSAQIAAENSRSPWRRVYSAGEDTQLTLW